jgi:hypothetical protein
VVPDRPEVMKKTTTNQQMADWPGSSFSLPLKLVQLLLLLVLVVGPASAESASRGWLTSAELERESSSPFVGSQPPTTIRSPVLIGQQLNGRSSYLFSRNNGRLLLPVEELRQTNLFQCVEPTRSLYENFARQYNRTFQDSAEKLERLQLFAVTLKRAIVLNRVIQNEVMNSSNRATRNYHFIEPLDNQNLALWYADVTDCELALIKNVLLDTFHFIDENKHHVALRIVQGQGQFDLPGLLNGDGFEQLANILLVRLYDRFRGDDKMNQLFEWPMYFKRLASFAYSQQQAQQADFKTKLAMVAFAYPAYFKDLKYNHPALNRTNDNLRANSAHKRFNERHGRRLANLKVANRRLSIFRQRWSLVNQLNADPGAEANQTARQLVPDWLRVQYLSNDDLQAATREESGPFGGPRSERLRLDEASQPDGQQVAAHERSDELGDHAAKPFRLTQFSDLTDNEFQAFLSNDFSLLHGNKESAEFLDSNFFVRPLSEQFRWELAHELELRHGAPISADNLELLRRAGQDELARARQPGGGGQLRPSLRLAKQVVDELISDVGLPIGPAALEGIGEEEQLRMFQRVASFFQKPYLLEEPKTLGIQLTNVDLLDERRLRIELFKENYPRFRAWFIKEGWSLSDAQMVAMLRLADMSWLEIKLSMFKICCLTSDNLIALSSTNATIQYLGSNYDLLCGTDDNSAGGNQSPDLTSIGFGEPAKAAKLQQQQQQQQQSAAELAALEIYYYYSVHFNKHHQNRAEFVRRFNIFRSNIESVRRHSCKRSLTLFESLKNKRADLLSTVDLLDPLRSHTDDLNLDRFEYFKLPARDLQAVPQSAAGAAFGAPPVVSARQTQAGGHSSGAESSRAGLSYRRDYFANLLDRANTAGSRDSNWPGSATASPATGYQTLGADGHIYANKLFDSWESVDEATRKYRLNNVARIYDLVMARYKWCKKNFEGVDLGSSELRQQCQANGPLGDQAAQLGGPGALWTDDLAGPGAATGPQQFDRLQQQDKCAFYRRGLDPWAEGLIKQESLSAQLIQAAKC